MYNSGMLLKRPVDSYLNPTFITIMSGSSLIGPIFYLIAVALSFVSIIVNLVLFIAVEHVISDNFMLALKSLLKL